MKEFNYTKIPTELINEEIMNLVSSIHEFKGKQDLYIEAKPDILTEMLNVAKIQSTGASNRIEGIHTTDNRLKALMNEKTEPKTRSEKEITGYRKVLETIHENYDFIPPKKNIILQLHRDMYSYTSASIGGRFKNSDNSIIEKSTDGKERLRFIPLSAFETPDAVERLCNEYIKAIDEGKINPLILCSKFIFDFLCIHPFNDGNGRMSRLLTLLLLYRSGYIVGKYISIEMLIENTKDTYYEVLEESSKGWIEGKHNYLPFVRYYLQIIFKAYKEFTDRVKLAQDRSLSKPERIRTLFYNKLEKLSKNDIEQMFPDISKSTIELTLSTLLKEGHIIKIGSGRATAYIKRNN